MPPQRNRRATRPVTYFIQAIHGGPVKIGRTTEANLERRLGEIQVGCPDVLRVVGNVQGNHERAFHARWYQRRLSGEWFHPTDDMRQWAPDIVLDDNRLSGDAVEACRLAYQRGWEDALRQAAVDMPAAVHEWLTEELNDLAQSAIESPNLIHLFAPRSHQLNEGVRLGEDSA